MPTDLNLFNQDFSKVPLLFVQNNKNTDTQSAWPADFKIKKIYSSGK